MRINGLWDICNDGVIRPVVGGAVLSSTGTWERVYFLVDTGADCTTFNAGTLALLGLAIQSAAAQLGGVGGAVPTVAVDTSIRFSDTNSITIVFKSRFAALTDPAALDISILGRDIINHFALIVDRPGNTVCLLRQPHRYVIHSS
jgi:Retroviral aspartyl protease